MVVRDVANVKVVGSSPISRSMFVFKFKDIPENGSFAGKTFVSPTPSSDKETEIDTLPGAADLGKYKKCGTHGKSYPTTQK